MHQEKNIALEIAAKIASEEEQSNGSWSRALILILINDLEWHACTQAMRD
jgi:hypothetical protein